ncbi:MAG TPA: hypothetical protein VF310_13495, partial [Vicinamibacteria bacterium]
MSRSRRAVLLISSLALMAPGLALADGLYLSLKHDGGKISAGQPAKLQLTAVATRSYDLPGTPEIVVDGGATPEVRAVEASGGLKVTPEKAVKSGYEVVLTQPGTYTMKARYRVNN